MENLKNQLMRIIIEQDEEIEKIQVKDYYFKNWLQVKEEKELLERRIKSLIEHLNALEPQKPIEIKQKPPVPNMSDAEMEDIQRFLGSVNLI